MKRIIFTFFTILSIVVWSNAQTTVMLGSSKDNTLYQSNTGAFSNGAGPALIAGQTNGGVFRRGVIAFDVSSIPSNATITDVKLKMQLTKTSSGTKIVSLHTISQDWGEGSSSEGSSGGGSGNGAAAATNDATWIHTFHTASTWTNAGGDYNSTASASLAVNALGSYTWTGGSLISDVQAWVSGSTSNFGWVMIGVETGIALQKSTKHFATKESTIASNRPELEVTYTVPTPLTGTYTIGGANADYATLGAAAADLTTLGVNGAVTFNVAAGTYTGDSLILTAITGASATNTITFDGGSAATTTIDYATSTTNAVILLDGADYVTIKNMTINNLNAAPAWGIRMANSANFNTVDNCIINMAPNLTASFSHIVGILGNASETSSSTAGDNGNNITITNNTITGGHYGFRWEGGTNSAGNLDTAITITNNILSGNAGYGIALDDVIDVNIHDNQIFGHGLSGKDGIDFNDITDFYITGNTISVADYAIEVDDGNYTNDGVPATGRSLIANNMLLSTGDDAINLDDAEEIDVFHNTCVTTATTTGRRALRFNDDVNLVFKNNIFVVDNGQTGANFNEAVWINDASSNAVFDYNIYYTGDDNLVNVGGSTPYTDLAAWKAANTAINQNSIEGKPMFVSATDLHIDPADGLANDVGDNSVGITTDIDGDTRPLAPSTTVDIGADEYAFVLPTNIDAVDDVVAVDYQTTVSFNPLVNDVTPNMLINAGISTNPSNGAINLNILTQQVTYTPNTGFCGQDMAMYFICDANGCDTASITFNVACPIPTYTIAQVHTEDANGVADSLNVNCELRGIVHGIDYDGNGGYSFNITDYTGSMNVFNFNDVDNYVVTEGDSVHIQGSIAQFNGLTEIVPDSIALISQGNGLYGPTVVTVLDESTEAALVRLNGVSLVTPSQWSGSGSYNVDVTDGTNTNTIRIDFDAGITIAAPTGTFDVIGLGGQFDNSSPYTSGYQILPRSDADFIITPAATPQLSFNGSATSVGEAVGSVTVDVTISSPNAMMATTVDVIVDGASTAMNGMDYTFTSPTTVTFPMGSTMSQTVSVTITDDMMQEGDETIVLKLTNANNGATFGTDSVYTITINDNDGTITNALILTGIYDGPLLSSPKGYEFYVAQNIPDLSVFGVGAANNGGGTDGVEFTFPAVAATAGQFIYLANDTTAFSTYFGFSADYEDNQSTGINGDDAIELFENGQVIDLYGDINVDGTGEPWEYLDSWVYRNCSTGPDSTFTIGDWTIAPINNFDNTATNATSPIPMTIGTYLPVCPQNIIAVDDVVDVDYETPVSFNPLTNDNIPNMLINAGIDQDVSNGVISLDLLTQQITYTPNNGFCGQDMATYFICDAFGCDTAMVTFNVACPIPYYPIATVTTNDATGVADSSGVECELRGVVYGIDFRGGGGYSFTLRDATGGINVFSFNDVNGYMVNEGDSIHVLGSITQFSGLTEIIPDSISVHGTGTLNAPRVVTTLDESTESDLVKIEAVTIIDPTQWNNSGSGFNVEVRNATDTLVMRIDNDCDLYAQAAPTGWFDVTGVGGQFDNSSPYTDGYQIFPRYQADINLLTNTTQPTLEGEVRFFPNPARTFLFVESEVELTTIVISNMLGQRVRTINSPNPQATINVEDLTFGVYTITFVSENATWTEQFVKSN